MGIEKMISERTYQLLPTDIRINELRVIGIICIYMVIAGLWGLRYDSYRTVRRYHKTFCSYGAPLFICITDFLMRTLQK